MAERTLQNKKFDHKETECARTSLVKDARRDGSQDVRAVDSKENVIIIIACHANVAFHSAHL